MRNDHIPMANLKDADQSKALLPGHLAECCEIAAGSEFCCRFKDLTRREQQRSILRARVGYRRSAHSNCIPDLTNAFVKYMASEPYNEHDPTCSWPDIHISAWKAELTSMSRDCQSSTEAHRLLVEAYNEAALSERTYLKIYLKTLNWEVLSHCDIAPSDYQLFRSMARALSEQRFTSYEDTKNWVDSWITSKDKEFLRLGIQTLP
ncbi:Mariner Mos1 transposase [Eumeta japonica]|uniref:Mariner Mos1 transposase n=1 Tax=Eumeta variegata TaxID=151549 RepID=A0A4C1X6N6_EUMVA|nr:Mariner Mos1 transposase [Eumeta japonica]